MRFRLGLTGSIGMGKSTAARMFQDEGCALWDADAAVHRLYGPDGAAVPHLRQLFPEAITGGMVSREKLREIIGRDAGALPRIEAIVHPLVRRDRADFAAAQDGIGVFDMPLLFETGAEAEMDAVACVSVPADLQRQRVLARGSMSAEDLDLILARQMPNDQKCARSDYVINTDTLDHARAQVAEIMTRIKEHIDA